MQKQSPRPAYLSRSLERAFEALTAIWCLTNWRNASISIAHRTNGLGGSTLGYMSVARMFSVQACASEKISSREGMVVICVALISWFMRLIRFAEMLSWCGAPGPVKDE